MTDVSDIQTIQCAGTLEVTSTSASCSVDFVPVQGLISREQCSDLIAAIAIVYLLKRVFDLILDSMTSRR